MTTTADLAAAVISEARDRFNATAAEFDYHIKCRGIGGPAGELGQACYVVATQHMATAVSTDEREAAWMQLWADLQDELRTYEQRCRNRQYLGWSTAARDRGQRIRYAP